MAVRSDNKRYNGPRVPREEAIAIALQFAKDTQLPTGSLMEVRHCRPIIYGRADDTFDEKWEVEIASIVPPDEPGVITCPPPDSPFIVQINEQSGEASLFLRL